MDTKVSLKQALASLGFKGGTKHDSEWNQWINHEKEVLAGVMERHGIEWEKKGTHEEHLSVYDYKKKVRSEEVKALEKENALLTVQNESLIGQMVESRADIKILEQTKADAEKAVEEAKDRADHAEKEAEKHEKRLENLKPIIDSMNAETADFKEKIEEQLPQAGTLELASSYREKKAKPLFIRMKNKIASLAVRVEQVTQKLTNARIEIKILKREKKSLQEENSILIEKNKELQEENAVLKSIAIMFDRVVRVMGEDTVFLAVRKDEEREKFENRKKEQPEKEQSVLKRLEIAKQTVAVREEDKIKSKPKKWNMER
nr:hypothetical protein [Blautia glucerasea]